MQTFYIPRFRKRKTFYFFLGMNSEEWYDTGTKTTFHFDDNGMFVDSNGKGPQKGFKNNGKFSDWLHNLVVNRIKKLGLIEKCHPENGAPIYHTSNAFNSPEKLLVIIQGTGRVRAGVWLSLIHI